MKVVKIVSFSPLPILNLGFSNSAVGLYLRGGRIYDGSLIHQRVQEEKEKMLKKSFLFVSMLLSVFFIFATVNAIEQKLLPAYDQWDVCEVEQVGEKIIKRVCLDNNIPPQNIISEFMFINDRGEQQSELLIWTELIHTHGDFNKTRMINRFYLFRLDQTGKNNWFLVDITIFDIHTLPSGKRFPLFSPDSSFGKAFYSFHEKAGIQREDIKIPYVINK